MILDPSQLRLPSCLFFFFPIIFLLFLCFLRKSIIFMYYIKLYFIFPFTGISKMYTDIIRGESMIICGFTSIFFGILRSKLLSISSFKGKGFFLSMYFLKSFLYGTYQFILKIYSRYLYYFPYTLLMDQFK